MTCSRRPRPSSIAEIVIHDTRKAREIGLPELFTETYRGLGDMIRHATTPIETGWGIAPPDIGAAQRAKQEWEKNIQWNRFLGTIVFKNGKRNPVRVFPRTDFDPGKKTPNITYLQFPDGEFAVLREMRMYSEEAIKPFLRDSSVSLDAYRAMLNGTFNGFDPANWSDLQGYRKRYFFVPERILVPALERLVEEEGFPRITPHIKLFPGYNGNLYGVRAFHPQFKQLPYSDQAIAQLTDYLGRLTALGLNDECDRQAEHYVFDGPHLVNIDPDFVRLKARAAPNARQEKQDMRDHELLRFEVSQGASSAADRTKEDSLRLYPPQMDRVLHGLFDQYQTLAPYRATFLRFLEEEAGRLAERK